MAAAKNPARQRVDVGHRIFVCFRCRAYQTMNVEPVEPVLFGKRGHDMRRNAHIPVCKLGIRSRARGRTRSQLMTPGAIG